MKSVLLLQFTRLKRAPALVLSFFILTIIFVAMLAGSESEAKITVYTYSETLDTNEVTNWVATLNQSDGYDFQLVGSSEVKELIETGDINFALQLNNWNYKFLVGTEDEERIAVEQYVTQVFREEIRLNELVGKSEIDKIKFRSEVKLAMENPVITVKTQALEESSEASTLSGNYQLLFGTALHFSIYTVLFSLMNIVDEKRQGTWDRLILSPIRKLQIYLGHLCYCFLIGFLQITFVFLFFDYVYGYDFGFGPNFGAILLIIGSYIFSIVALGMLVMGLVKSTQQLQAVNPLIATGMAMLGGAFWPLEAVSNQLLLALSKGMPIFYGIKALEEVIIYNKGIMEVLPSISFMLLFGVICMGVGVNLMERVKG
ncbi:MULTISPECIES: ABC transporter permease [Paraliobacillus]|uniref:ABC transporter permease n=1 Tax=Paraliobacillus TaxID=200903 RepID=UPI000DD3B218|nr:MULTISPECIES: ABC transporter permease [Paraliobacillus]